MSDLHDVPTAAELVEAVRAFLLDDVMAASDGRLRFHARVAANMLAVVQRELEQGPAMEAAHRERLARLGVASEAELAAAIRGGALDDRYDDVAAALRATVQDKVRVANPKYLEQPT